MILHSTWRAILTVPHHRDQYHKCIWELHKKIIHLFRSVPKREGIQASLSRISNARSELKLGKLLTSSVFNATDYRGINELVSDLHEF
jgi:hypothetical protein